MNAGRPRIEEKLGEGSTEKNKERSSSRVALAFEGMRGGKTEKKEGRRRR